MRAERVRRTRRNDQQIASPRGDDIILDQQVERALMERHNHNLTVLAQYAHGKSPLKRR
jgi:hypothetical protein